MIRTSPTVGHNSEALRSFMEGIESAEARLAYALRQIERCKGISPATMSRAYRLCALVFSTEYETAKHIVWSRRATLIGALDFRCIGFVYWATSDEEPDRVKIGFTTDLDKRAKQLTRLCGTTIKVRRYRAGTMLEEHAFHCENRASRIAGEWFRAEAA